MSQPLYFHWTMNLFGWIPTVDGLSPHQPELVTWLGMGQVTKIAGMYGCSSPLNNAIYILFIYSYWSMAIYPMLIWLLVDLPLRKKMSSSVGIIIPNWMESHKTHVPNHQPGISPLKPLQIDIPVQAPQSECPKHSFHPPAMRRVPLVQPQVARNYHPGRWGLGREACRHHLGPCWPFRTWSQHVSDFAGWWLTYPSEKIWTSVGIILPNIWKNKKCSKPPTSFDFARWELWWIQHEIVTIHLEGNNIGRCFTAWSVKTTG